MSNGKSAVDEFLNQAGAEESKFENKDKNPFADMKIEQEEEPEVKEEAKEEKPLPFHQDPKIRRHIEKEVARLTKNMTPREEQKFREEVSESEDLVGAFTAIIGNDTPEKQHALKMLKKTVTDLEEKAQAPLRQIEAQQRAEQEAVEELENGFENIEETFGVDLTSQDPEARKMKSKFVDFIEKIAPKDKNGDILEYPDFQETFKLFQEISKKTAPSNARNRQLASRSMAPSSESSATPAPQGNSWKDVEKFFSSLKG